MHVLTEGTNKNLIAKFVYLGNYFDHAIAKYYLEMSLIEFKEKFPSLKLTDPEWIEHPGYPIHKPTLAIKCKILNIDEVPVVKNMCHPLGYVAW